MKRTAAAACVTSIALGVAACGRAPEPLDLLQAGARLTEATAGGHGRQALLAASEKGLRLDDVIRRGFPAGPPGRLRFALDIPKGARLTFACAIDPRFHDRPGVEFSVKVKRGGREELVWTHVLDPIAHRNHRKWVPVEVDLSKYAGRGRELALETHGYEETGVADRAWWGTPAVTTAASRAPLVVVYLVDTLRADHTGVYGYGRKTTPELDAFAGDAVVFDQAIVHASWTKPSVASILTSRLPGQHRAVQLRDALDPSNVTIAQRLRERGWGTGAAIANSVIYAAESAFDRGFELFAGLHGEDDRPSKLTAADVVVDEALAWLGARRGLPTFLYVHTMDPHVPYAPPPPFDQMFEPHPREGHPAQDPRTDYKEPLDRDRLIAQYDGDVAFGDREFGRFLRWLKAAGVYGDALVIFLSDHGEEFLDHGRWLHGRSVFDELIRVPLVVKFPGNRGAGSRVAEQVQGIDVVPTVLQVAGLPIPKDIVGQPLQRTVQGIVERRVAISEISHRGFVAHGVRTGGDKYVRRFSPEDDELLFDLAKDPGELTNVAAARPERVRLLKAAAESAMAPNPFRYVVQVAGRGRFALRVAARGWLEGVETTGFGPDERSTLGGNGRWLEISAHPQPGQPREVSFTARPLGAPVELDGVHDGRRLRTADVAIGEDARHPPGLPWRLPDIESETERGNGANLFVPPKSGGAGVRLWLTLPPGRTLTEFDKETRERLKALGYLGPG
jgi:arylsulfatase A-like enzyme